MKEYKWLLTLLTAFVGILFFSFNGNTKVKADYGEWYDGVPEFLNDDNYMNRYGGETSYDPDSDTLTSNTSQNEVSGNDLSYTRASKHVYYIYAEDDESDDAANYVTYFKIKKLSGDRIKVYFSQNDDCSDLQYWGTYTAE